MNAAGTVLISVPADEKDDWLRLLLFVQQSLVTRVRANGGVAVLPPSLHHALRALTVAEHSDTPPDVRTFADRRSHPRRFQREYDASKAAEVLGVGVRAVQARCRRGSLAFTMRPGNGGLRFVLDADEVDAIAARSALRPVRAVDVPARPAAEPARSGVDPMTGQRPELMAAVARYGVALGPLSAGDPLPALLKLAVDQGVIRSVQEPIWVSRDGRVGSVAVAGLEVRS